MRPLPLLSLAFGALIAPATAYAQLQERSRPASQPAPEDGLLRGTVVVTDASGKRHERLNGEMNLVLWQARFGTHHKVEITEGRWSARVDPGEGETSLRKVAFVSCVLDGNVVRIEGDGVAFPPKGPIEVHGRFLPKLSLRVVDAETKAELRGLRVVADLDWMVRNRDHPGTYPEANCIVRDGASPLVLPDVSNADADARMIWVRAPDHAWQRLEILLASGGERFVALQKAAELLVKIEGPRPEGPCFLRIYPAGGKAPPVAEIDLGGGELLIDGLLPGAYRVSVERGDWFREPLSYGSSKVQVVAGEKNELTLTCKERHKEPASTTLGGTLRLPAQWEKIAEIRLVLEAEGRSETWMPQARILALSELEEGKQEGEYRFEFSKVPAGTYQLRVEPAEVRVSVNVREQGLMDFEIEVPPPQEVTVQVLDHDTRKPVAGASLTWHGRMPPSVTGWSPKTVTASRDGKEFRFHAPEGEIWVSVNAEGYAWDNQQFVVSTAKNKFLVELSKPCGVKVVLRDGGTEVPHEMTSVEVIPLEGQPELRAWSNQAVMVQSAGRYKLVVKSPAGYRAIPDREVTVKRGEILQVGIDLERR